MGILGRLGHPVPYPGVWGAGAPGPIGSIRAAAVDRPGEAKRRKIAKAAANSEVAHQDNTLHFLGVL